MYKGGVHVQERGNVALPVDIVKVLKSQDGNYIRTIRMAGLKVPCIRDVMRVSY